MRIGIFGGSFNPIHIGHAMVASYCVQRCDLDEVWLMPSRVNPLKTSAPPVSDAHRLAMCKLVADKVDGLKVSDFEQELPAPSYTYRTLCKLREEHPDDEFVLIIGSDNWHIFPRWRNYKELREEFGILIYPRPWYGVHPGGAVPKVKTIEDPEAPSAEISSTFIRDGIKRGMNMNFYLTQEVIEYIKENRLYE